MLIHVISCTVAPSVPIMWGSATLTMEESIAPIRVPKVMEIVTSHLFGLGRATRKARRSDKGVAPGVMRERDYTGSRADDFEFRETVGLISLMQAILAKMKCSTNA